jgi:hypothetical protein
MSTIVNIQEAKHTWRGSLSRRARQALQGCPIQRLW